MQIHFRVKGIDNIQQLEGKGENTTLIDKDERARKRSGEKRKIAKNEECTAYRMWTLYGFFEGYLIRIFLSSKKVEII